MTLDQPTQSGSVVVSGLTGTDEVILVVASVSSAGGPTYGFTAGDATGISAGSTEDETLLTIVPSMNPFSNSVTLELLWSGNSASEPPAVDIYDVQGRVVNTLSPDAASAGSASFVWNTQARNGSLANSGVYYARARAGSEHCTTRLILLR